VKAYWRENPGSTKPKHDSLMSREEFLEKKQRTIISLRHKLQKNLLSKDQPPQAE
jgi:hypothetical protein